MIKTLYVFQNVRQHINTYLMDNVHHSVHSIYIMNQMDYIFAKTIVQNIVMSFH